MVPKTFNILQFKVIFHRRLSSIKVCVNFVLLPLVAPFGLVGGHVRLIYHTFGHYIGYLIFVPLQILKTFVFFTKSINLEEALPILTSDHREC